MHIREYSRLAYKWEDVKNFTATSARISHLRGQSQGEKGEYDGLDNKKKKEEASVCLNNYILEYIIMGARARGRERERELIPRTGGLIIFSVAI